MGRENSFFLYSIKLNKANISDECASCCRLVVFIVDFLDPILAIPTYLPPAVQVRLFALIGFFVKTFVFRLIDSF